MRRRLRALPNSIASEKLTDPTSLQARKDPLKDLETLSKDFRQPASTKMILLKLLIRLNELLVIEIEVFDSLQNRHIQIYFYRSYYFILLVLQIKYF